MILLGTRPTNNPSGRAVVGLYLDSHGYPIDSSYFLKGPLNWGVRPVGLAVAPCKAYGECLFITDDNSHRIIALAYAPDHSSPTPTSPPVVPPPVELNEPRSMCVFHPLKKKIKNERLILFLPTENWHLASNLHTLYCMFNPLILQLFVTFIHSSNAQ